jgi:murein DD-endopeptidase MepM/ murein hydrolase activator NlpD
MRDKLKKWWRGFVDKQKLAVLDGDDGSTKWYMYISPARVVVGFITLVLLVLVVVVVLVAYTPVMDTIPGYPGRRSREAITAAVMRLDSLEREMANLTVYSDNIGLIMEGKTPVVRNTGRVGDSIHAQDKTLIPRNAADSALRARLEGDGPWSLAASAAASRTQGLTADLVAPVKGLVQKSFSPVDGMYGIEIGTADQSPVVAARDGTVTLKVFITGEGYLVQLQHADNLVSVYRRLTESGREVGSRVKAGEIVGVAGPLVFELWYNGTAVDPLNYIVF